MSGDPPIPLTVIGGYLGAGKTTLLNRLLRGSGHDQRLGVIVNDFGDVGIDSRLLASASGDGGIIDLPNGCVCCSLANGLADALAAMADRAAARSVDHVVIEASGVADPAVVAHWSTVPPYRPGGVVVLAAADAIRQQAGDRYVGGEVRRQLGGADLLVLTKVDRCRDDELSAVQHWISGVTSVPLVTAVEGDVPASVVLGAAPLGRGVDAAADHRAQYETRTWTSDAPIARTELERLLDELAPEVVRAKGIVALDDGSTVDVQVVGRTIDVRPFAGAVERSMLVMIGVRSA